MYQKSILLIGDVGVIASSVASVILTRGYKIYIVSLIIDTQLPSEVTQYHCDRRSEVPFAELIKKITYEVGHWNIVFDITNSQGSDSAQTCALLGKSSDRLIFLSSILWHANLLTPFGEMGGYVDKKVRMEQYIQSQTLPWTILRPYHILGPHSLLGCIPDHNRDPELIDRLKRGEALSLCNGGDINFNIVHPADIGRAVLAIANNPQTIHKTYNCVNPEPVSAREYYAEIARQVGGTLKIKTKSYQEIWDEHGGWELTTLPHLYDASDLERDTGFTPRTSYQECIRDALANPPLIDVQASAIPVHQRMTVLPRPRRFSWLLD